MRKPQRTIVALVVLAVSAQFISAAGQIASGPFVIGVPGKTTQVRWLIQGDEARNTSPFRVESTSIPSLEPNTRYEYDLSSLGDSGKGSFKTPPAGSEPFSFVAYGDNRTRHDVHRRLIAELLQHGIPDFVLQSGDMVENGNDSAQWPVFFDIEKDLLRQTSFFPALGNHERHTPLFEAFFHEGVPYYSFDWGNAHFTILDSDIDNASPSETGRKAYWDQQVRWLEDDLKAHQTADYRFIVAHHPPMTAIASRQGTNRHMTALEPMFEQYRVSAGFFGHDHNYQHYLKNGVHYVISGGGGAPLYDVSKPPQDITVKVEQIENFVGISVNGKSAHFTAISIDGRTLDDFEIESPSTVAPKAHPY